MATVLEYGHTPFCLMDAGQRWQGVASVPVEPVPSTKQLLRWSEALAGIARTGLGFTESLYEQERFEEVLRVAADIRATIDEGLEGVEDADGLVEEWMASVGKGVPGYVTPKVAVGAAVGNDSGEILLVQRADSGVWLYPTGWADVGYSAAEVVVKEVEEETGIEVEVVRLIAVLDGLRIGLSRIPLYSLVFQCRPIGGELKAHPLECSRRRLVRPGGPPVSAGRRRALGPARVRRPPRRPHRGALRLGPLADLAGGPRTDLTVSPRMPGRPSASPGARRWTAAGAG